MKRCKLAGFVGALLLFTAVQTYAIGLYTALAIVAVVGTEAVGRFEVQAEAWVQWSRGQEFTAEQHAQVQRAIDHLKKKGFKDEAKQLQEMFDGGYILYNTTAGTTTFAVTYGGTWEQLVNTGFITLRDHFFDSETDDGIPVDSEERRTRVNARTLIHELEHVNGNSNVLIKSEVISNWIRNAEYWPTVAHIRAMPGIGYTRAEITKIKDRYGDTFGDVFDDVLAGMETEEASAGGQSGVGLPSPSAGTERPTTAPVQDVDKFK